MKKIVFILLAIGLLAFSCKTRSGETVTVDLTPQDSLAATKAALTLPEEPVFDIVTTEGTIRVRLFKDTPLHRDNFSKLALAGYYDNLLFHRVINGFMIQGGVCLIKTIGIKEQRTPLDTLYTLAFIFQARP